MKGTCDARRGGGRWTRTSALLGRTMRYHGRQSWLPLPPTRIGQHPSPPHTRQPQPRHLTLLVTGDRPQFEVTHLRRDTA
jgi:hypothetical protein